MAKQIDTKYFDQFDTMQTETQKDIHILAVTDYYGLPSEEFKIQHEAHRIKSTPDPLADF